MKKPGFLVKLAAVASAIVLAGGFVCYRGGAFAWLGETSAETLADATPQPQRSANPPQPPSSEVDPQNRLSLADIARMTRYHVSDAVIIQQIRSTHSHYKLRPDDIIWLKRMEVSDNVVIEMQSTPAPDLPKAPPCVPVPAAGTPPTPTPPVQAASPPQQPPVQPTPAPTPSAPTPPAPTIMGGTKAVLNPGSFVLPLPNPPSPPPATPQRTPPP